MNDHDMDGCDYQGYEFGAGSYPDSICIGGRLFDADNCDEEQNLFEPLEDIPCPICRKRDAIRYWSRINFFNGDLSKREAIKMAKHLVLDIRKNRGMEK